jgi:hypothetical protein
MSGEKGICQKLLKFFLCFLYSIHSADKMLSWEKVSFYRYFGALGIGQIVDERQRDQDRCFNKKILDQSIFIFAVLGVGVNSFASRAKAEINQHEDTGFPDVVAGFPFALLGSFVYN